MTDDIIACRPLLENIGAAVFLVEADTGRILDANASAAEFYGYDIETLKKKNISDIDVFSERKPPAEISNALLEKPFCAKSRHRLSSGEVRDVEIFYGQIYFGSKKLYLFFINDVTDLTLAAKKLEMSELIYRTLFENMFDGFIYCAINRRSSGETPDYTIIDCNNAFEALSGLLKSDVAGIRISELRRCCHELAGMIEGLFDCVRSSGKPVTKEHYCERTGKWFKVLAYTPLAEYFVAIFSDISAYRRYEMEIKKSQVFLKTTMDRITAPMAIMSEFGNLLYVNSAWEKCDTENPFNLHVDIGDNYFSVLKRAEKFSQELYDRLNVLIYSVKSGVVETASLEYSYEKNGAAIWHTLSITCFWNANYLNIMMFHEDITPTKLREKEHTVNKRRLEALLRLNQANDMSIGQLKDFALEEAVKLTESAAGFLMFKIEDEEALLIHSLTRDVSEKCRVVRDTPEFDIANSGIWAEPARTGRPLVVNDYVASDLAKKGIPSGHIPITKFMSVPVFEKSKLIAVAAVANKAGNYSEMDLSQLILLMDGMWKVIQKKRSEELLIEAHEHLKELDRMKTDFLSTVSHELRTPLTSIMGFIKMIKKKLNNSVSAKIESFDEKTRRNYSQVMDNIGIIEIESERLTGLINNVLDIAKMEAGKVEWDMATISIVEVVEHSISATSSLVERKNLELAREFGNDMPSVYGDFDRLVQVMINLISNAVKFTEKGFVKISVAVHEGMLKVSVVDTGIGIDECRTEEVFEKFRQVTDTILDKPAGTGLGLSICRQIVEHHGGKIWCESEPGEGSSFHFTLPFAARAD